MVQNGALNMMFASELKATKSAFCGTVYTAMCQVAA